MLFKRNGWLFLFGILLLYILVTVLAFFTVYVDPLDFAIRLCALYGFMALAIASAMTPFLKEITLSFGRPFIRIHHLFAVFGLVFATLHPVFFAIQRMDLAVFIPRFDDWYTFWSLAGRPALYIIYIATIVAFLRMMIPKYWRYFHMLMYLILIFVIVHANLIGTDFQNLGILIIMNILFIIAFAAFFIKRYQTYQRKQRTKARKQESDD